MFSAKFWNIFELRRQKRSFLHMFCLGHFISFLFLVKKDDFSCFFLFFYIFFSFLYQFFHVKFILLKMPKYFKLSHMFRSFRVYFEQRNHFFLTFFFAIILKRYALGQLLSSFFSSFSTFFERSVSLFLNLEREFL